MALLVGREHFEGLTIVAAKIENAGYPGATKAHVRTSCSWCNMSWKACSNWHIHTHTNSGTLKCTCAPRWRKLVEAGYGRLPVRELPYSFGLIFIYHYTIYGQLLTYKSLKFLRQPNCSVRDCALRSHIGVDKNDVSDSFKMHLLSLIMHETVPYLIPQFLTLVATMAVVEYLGLTQVTFNLK